MTEADPPYEATRRDGVLCVRDQETEWLSSGWNGGRTTADCAYNVSVPEGWNRTDLEAYITDRLERARFAGESDPVGNQPAPVRAPVLLTGVDIEHARGARCGSVTAYATAGISNPAALPMEPTSEAGLEDVVSQPGETRTEGPESPGTVNLIVGTTRALAPGALTNALAVAAEAKATTLLAETGFPGTTTDAIVVGHDPRGRRAAFSGSATPVGAATRACIREALRASLRSRYGDSDASVPNTVTDAADGVSTDVEARVFRPPRESSTRDRTADTGS
ncbi:adenosylcobinamide amidohydrolase [Natrarchaeobius halalkaliphilus]|uniref:Adenosylcobinamide amidohydrolase n=1 Tax=Natrarchaeobius halalkaliphilus TaxID=1679091 RepID=A0A3N6LIQ2_9EURY|nr:adenosylcobinamide amidohydrolase [Natrarchaeobius halalkaliphilus]